MAEWQPPRGTRDLMPNEMALWRKLFQKWRTVFESYGYGEVVTPAFEDFALLSKKSGPAIEEEIYAFEDKGGRKLGLRFDPTVPICRIIASTPNMPKPIKFYYITRMWRYDRPGAGRYREFWQAGCELVGPKGAAGDVEVLQVASELLRAAGVKDFVFRVNSRKLVERIVKEAGISAKSVPDVLRSIDKLSKVGSDGVWKELKQKGVSKEQFEELTGYLSYDPDCLQAMEKWEEFAEVMEIRRIAEVMGLKNISLDASIVRGIDYYTGFVFETFIKGKENLGSVCSGGRYDNLIKVYGGEDLPAVGFGLGIDRLLDAIEAKAEPNPVKIFIAAAKDDVRKEVADTARFLRNEGVSTETDLMDRDLKKQLDYANSKKIPYVMVIGPKEIKENVAVLRDMKTGKEEKVKISDLPKKMAGVV